MTDNNVVYWIRHKNHTDIMTQGYVGVTCNFEQRMRSHLHKANGDSDYTVHRAMRKYGADIVKTVVTSGDEEFCYFVESELRPEPDTAWNIAAGGLIPPLSGKQHSDETRAKMSAASKGRPKSAEHCRNIGLAQKGRTMSDAAKEIIRAKATGRVKSEESKLKFSQAMTGRNLWDNSAARKDLWAMADKFYEAYLVNPKSSARKLAESFGMVKCNPWKLKEKLVTGWNPSQDREWLDFKSSYEGNHD